MARTASNHWNMDRNFPGEKYCHIFGHLVKRFGDGDFCITCDKPAAEILNEKWAEGGLKRPDDGGGA